MTDSTSYNMNDEAPSKIKNALNFGALLGLVLMVINLINFVFELYDNQAFGYITWVIMIGGIIIGIKNYRDNTLNGFISYGSALGYGVLISLFAAIIASFASYVYLSFVDASFIEFTLEQTEITMIEQGQPEEAIEMAMSWTKKIMSPMGLFITGIFATTILGFVISLIASAFLKKDPDSFENA